MKRNAFKIIVCVCLVACALLVSTSCGMVETATDFFEGMFSKDVLVEGNAYAVYVDFDGRYRVVANGETVKTFDNSVRLVPAADNSFAYIFETNDEGTWVYVLEGKEVSSVVSYPVEKILATATLSPAVVWYDSESVYLYNAKLGEDRITKEYDNAFADTENHDFCISADGKTVAYTMLNEETGDTYLYVYKDGTSTRLQKNMYSVALSDDGSMIYAKASKDGIRNSLYVIPVKSEESYHVADNFLSVVDFNIGGNEIVYTASDAEDGVITAIAYFDNDLKNISTKRICSGAVVAPVSPDGSVARFATFEYSFFVCDVAASLENLIEGMAPVYYVTSSFESMKLSNYAGKFSSDGNFFYYVGGEGELRRIDLNSADLMPEQLTDEVVEFAVTEKGNIYVLDDFGTLAFYDVTREKKTRIADDVSGISMHEYTNTLYFTLDDTVTVYCTTEGEEKEQARFDGNSISGLPRFINSNAKKTYVGYYDEDNVEWKLYYTSNGKKFEYVDVCDSIFNLIEFD